MKKIIILFCFTLSAVGLSAQIHYKFQGGLNITDYTTDGEGLRLGYKLGAGIGYHFTDELFVDGSLLFSTKGTKGHGVNIEQRYVQFPVNLGLRYDVSDKFDLLFTGGLYVAYGINGRTQWREGRIGWTVPTFSDRNYWGTSLSRFDAGFQTGLGLDFGRYIFGLEFEIGGVPLIKYYDDDPDPTNMGLSLTFAIRFGSY